MAGNFPHITISHASHASAKDSNDIESWKDIPPFTISGTVQEWSKYNKKTVSPSVLKEKKSSSLPLQLETISLLKKHKNDEYLTKTLHLKAVKHKKYLNLVQYSYSHSGCDMSNGIVQECRGIIIDNKNWEVVAFPYAKFFNYGDPMADEINWRYIKMAGKK